MRLGGVTEVADELGISRQRVAELRERPEFPGPIAEIAAGPIWDLDEIEAWLSSGCYSKRPGRPALGSRRKTFGRRFALESDEPIGQGGFAKVYRAVDLVSGSRGYGVVAVKTLLRPDDQEAHRRFRRELRLLSGLDHPNVIPILGQSDDDEDELWYAMPLAFGSLDDELHHRVGDDAGLVDVMLQICAGLACLHSQGIVHRDLKPSNVLRTKSGAWAISDFNLARETDRQTTALTTTAHSGGFGTYVYAAPELWSDPKNAGAAADIFSLGKLMHALVIGRDPAPSDDPPPGMFRPIIQRATGRRPEERYQSAEEIVADLRSAATSPQGRWDGTEEAIERLISHLREEDPPHDALSELFQIAQGSDAEQLYSARHNTDPSLAALQSTIPHLTVQAIRGLWKSDPDGFRAFFRRYSEFIRSGSFGFDFCDTIAGFCARVVATTGDGEVLRAAVAGLAELGSSHNRWNVRSTLGSMLQEVRTTEHALDALHGLREAGARATDWALEDFTLRSLHPTLRRGVSELLGRAN